MKLCNPNTEIETAEKEMQSYDPEILRLKGEHPKHLHLVTFPIFFF